MLFKQTHLSSSVVRSRARTLGLLEYNWKWTYGEKKKRGVKSFFLDTESPAGSTWSSRAVGLNSAGRRFSCITEPDSSSSDLRSAAGDFQLTSCCQTATPSHVGPIIRGPCLATQPEQNPHSAPLCDPPRSPLFQDAKIISSAASPGQRSERQDGFLWTSYHHSVTETLTNKRLMWSWFRAECLFDQIKVRSGVLMQPRTRPEPIGLDPQMVFLQTFVVISLKWPTEGGLVQD